MNELKRRGLIKKTGQIREDLKKFKILVKEKLRVRLVVMTVIRISIQNTPWLIEKDNLRRSLLNEYEDKINDIVVYFDLDENNRDLELLKVIENKYKSSYESARKRHAFLMYYYPSPLCQVDRSRSF